MGIRYSGSVAAAANRLLLDEARSLSDDLLVLAVVPRNPQLLNGYVIAHELGSIPEDRRTEDNRDWHMLAMLETANRGFQEQPDKFPLGGGPLEEIHAELENGTISAAGARSVVADPEFVWELGGAYLRAVNRHCVQLLQDQATFASGWSMQELALAAVDGFPDRVVEDTGQVGEMLRIALDFMFDETVGDWLLAANMYLREVPDARVYGRAQELGRLVSERLLAAGEREAAGRLLFRQAVLGIDPYSGLPSDWPLAQVQLANKLRHALGPQLPPEVHLPASTQALATSEGQLRVAAELTTGNLRARVFKALFDCLVNQEQLDVEIDRTELATVAGEALVGLDPDRDRHHLASVRTIVRQLGLVVPQQRTAPRTESLGPGSTGRGSTAGGSGGYAAAAAVDFQTAMLEAVESAGSDPEGALDTLVALQEAARGLGVSTRNQLWELQRKVVVDHADPEHPALADLGRRLRAVEALIPQDREHEGPALLVGWRESWETLTTRAAPAEMVRRASMRLGINAGSNFSGPAPVLSAYWYGEALADALALEPAWATDLVRRLGLLVRDNRQPEVAEEVCAVLTRHARALYAAGDTTRTTLHRTVQHALADVLLSDAPLERTADRLRQLLKGLGFALALSDGAGFTPDAQDVATLQAMAELTLGPSAVDESEDGLFAEDALLTTFTTRAEIRPGQTAQERLANMQRAFDERVFRALTAGTARDEHPWQELDDLRSRLDDETALLDIVAGVDLDDRLVLHTLVTTGAETVHFRQGVADLPGFATPADDDGTVLRHPLADDVRRLRAAVTEHPGLGRDVGREAQQELAALGRRLWGTGRFAELLADLGHRGVEHLMVVPHGPLHFVPFHLLPFGDGVLADAFTVTLLPNRQLLTAGRDSAAGRVAEVAALGMTFAERVPFGLPPLPGSAAEATDVAGAFGLDPALDASATEGEVRRSLAAARFVHVSTHGRNTSAGAAFQLVYLWPDTASDGRLHAFELLDLDLAGLEVLTLSACESALGRFDLMDDLRGIPASVLLRGARAVVGTLWEVDADAAHTFFAAFYRQLAQTREGVRRAFRAAQTETREAHPAWRDWGAFYLLGVS
ncbi:MAG: CHAT domain-containing protein [Nocardioidaceae bacterium]